jgi:hypothetical protein
MALGVTMAPKTKAVIMHKKWVAVLKVIDLLSFGYFYYDYDDRAS